MQRTPAVPRLRFALLTSALLTLTLSVCAAQQTTTRPKPAPKAAPSTSASPEQQMQAELAKHPEVFEEFGLLVEKMEAGVKLPPPRSDSRLLPLASKSTVFYAAFPNYGDAAMQALTVFRQELKSSSVLRQWWQGPDMAKNAPQIEDAIEKFYRISQYLGDEIVTTAAMEDDAPHVVVVAEIKKPGLKAVLEQTIAELSAKSKTKPAVRVLDVNELAALPDTKTGNDTLVLVRPDYLVISPDAVTLRRFNSRLDAGTADFASTAFGQRIAQAYQDHVTIVSGIDLQSILGNVRSSSGGKQALTAIDATGFSDAQYLVWEHANQRGHDVSKTELSFVAPRRGIAAWLGAPVELGSLDFASPKAMSTMSIVFAHPAGMFDDIRRLATSANPNALAGVSQMEQGLKINLQEDVLRPLGGEITFELDGITPTPTWKAILKVNDPQHLEATLNTLLSSTQTKSEQFVEAGTTYHKVPVGTGPSAMEVTYAFTDGYLVIGSSAETATNAVRLHRSGESLAQSARFRAALPPGHRPEASVLVFQDPATMAALQMQRFSPEMAAAMAGMAGQNTPAVMAAYADEKSIRGESTSPAMDAGMVLIVAAVAIPNLLRSRVAANEASAVGSLRTINTAQVTYAATYPDHGYAPNLATLGGSTGQVSSDRAGLIDASLACESGWCEKSGYRFHISAVCLQGQCPQYVVTATPINANTGSRNFCTTSDGQIRFKAGPPLTAAINAAECRRWTSLQ